MESMRRRRSRKNQEEPPEPAAEVSSGGGGDSRGGLGRVAAYKALFIRPDLNNKKPAQEGEEVQELDYGDGVRPRSDGERKSQDYYTVLILGRDTGGGGNTDTMLLASYDVTNQKATVMSIPGIRW